MKKGQIVYVNFALGGSNVQLLDFHHKYKNGETVWQVQDIITAHCDFVGESWMQLI